MTTFLNYRKGDNVTLDVDLTDVCGLPKEAKLPRKYSLGVVCDTSPLGTMLVKFKGRRDPLVVRRAYLRKEKITTLKLPKWAKS
jgi:hypothetical protein